MLRSTPTRQGRYLVRDVPNSTKKPNTKRKSGIEGRNLTETQDVTVVEDVNTRVRRPEFEDTMLLQVGS